MVACLLTLGMFAAWKNRMDTKLSLLAAAVVAALFTVTYKQYVRRALQACYGRLTFLLGRSTAKQAASVEATGTGHVTALYIYPVKSLRAIACQEACMDDKGLVGDRRFMIVTDAPPKQYDAPLNVAKRFLTQRQCPSLATIAVELSHGNDEPRMTLQSTQLGTTATITLNMRPMHNAPVYKSTLWGDVVQVQDMGDDAAAFVQDIVARDDQYVPTSSVESVRLVAQHANDTRTTKDEYVPWSARSLWGFNPKVALSDGFPILIACEASLTELNVRLVAKNKAPVSMRQFRPNIVVRGTVAFEEDYWKVIRIGNATLHVVKPCPRCKQSCTSQETGAVSEEPLVTLADFRAKDSRNGANVYFGQNVIPAQGAVGAQIYVGDDFEVLEWGEPIYSD